MTQVNKTQLNKLRSHIDKNKVYLDSIGDTKDSDEQKYSKALSMCILMEYFGLNQNSSLGALTDASGDNKIDAFYYSDDEDELSELVIIQSKYKQKDGDTGSFTEDDIKLCINSCNTFLNGGSFEGGNEKLNNKVSEYRKLLEENGLPAITIKLFLATNGVIHEGHKKLKEVVECIDKNIVVIFVDATFYGNEFSKEKSSININLKDMKDKTDSIFSIDDRSYSGVIASCSIKELMGFYEGNGERFLLNNNVRFFIKNSSINKEIKKSFIEEPQKFCYLNNGISIVCSDYVIEPTGHELSRVELTRPSVVNGGQTLASLYQLYLYKCEEYKEQFDSAKILIRIYKVPIEYGQRIARATNSQNPINVVDLHSNDRAQSVAKEYLEKRGIGLITKIGEDMSYYDDIITNENILQIYASLYGDDPAKAKLSKALIFKKYYDSVFTDSIDDVMLNKLYRCYQISKFIQNQLTEDSAIIKNAFYSIVYIMKKKEVNILNEDIPENDIQKYFKETFLFSIKCIREIIENKKEDLGVKFSMNNLFKGNEIKDLIDLKLGE